MRLSFVCAKTKKKHFGLYNTGHNNNNTNTSNNRNNAKYARVIIFNKGSCMCVCVVNLYWVCDSLRNQLDYADYRSSLHMFVCCRARKWRLELVLIDSVRCVCVCVWMGEIIRSMCFALTKKKTRLKSGAASMREKVTSCLATNVRSKVRVRILLKQSRYFMCECAKYVANAKGFGLFVFFFVSLWNSHTPNTLEQTYKKKHAKMAHSKCVEWTTQKKASHK